MSSGLGGMSGAQPKAANIAGAVGIFAEVDRSRIETRYNQGWVERICRRPGRGLCAGPRVCGKRARRISIAYHGNIVDLLEYAAETDFHIDLL